MTSRESLVEMPLPGGGMVRSRRRMTRLPDGLTWIEEDMVIRGRLFGPFVTGPGWMLERHLVRRGTAGYVQDGAVLPITSSSFVLFYAPFSVTELVAEDLETRWVGLGGEAPSAPAEGPLILEVPPDETVESPADLLALFGARRAARPFDRSTRPSPLARRARSLLDASYRDAPRIAALAARLSVSHAHLTRAFKRDFGLTPLAYRHALRATEAARRLTEGEPIVDVAGEVGYEDLGRFYKSFRKAMRSSPGRCRPA